MKAIIIVAICVFALIAILYFAMRKPRKDSRHVVKRDNYGEGR